MKVAIIGSRSLHIDIPEDAVPKNTTLIISGGADGVDKSARAFAATHHIQMLEILPDYAAFGRRAPLRRNDHILEAADLVLVFWDGKSRGSQYMIRRCRETGTPVRIFRFDP